MRRVMLPGILTLVLSRAALAGSVHFEIGTFIAGGMNELSFTNPFAVRFTGFDSVSPGINAIQTSR
jgi:hypothetical protein